MFKEWVKEGSQSDLVKASTQTHSLSSSLSEMNEIFTTSQLCKCFIIMNTNKNKNKNKNNKV